MCFFKRSVLAILSIFFWAGAYTPTLARRELLRGSPGALGPPRTNQGLP